MFADMIVVDNIFHILTLWLLCKAVTHGLLS